ncbi:urease accessory protein UreE [Salipiger mucosus]|uniref:Urease accessory protein UreE n=1 Tax=Salipiger mucosus DSM 16094 TaxID=1123237 RepID=S9Q7C9_9RHOB|nr:urease accessory protein UreE [Salipiger mucosus]EPX75942.1 Urease accessory protein UreE [Salipiger mucosus DSM 16094]
MSHLPHAHEIARKGQWQDAAERVVLSYEDRFLRRKVLRSEAGTEFLVDLAHTESLDHGDAFRLAEGGLVEVVAAAEPLLAVTGADLPRIAWHIGNRHTPCQIEGTRLLIQRDHVIRDMLERIGAAVAEVEEPFTPEGGAYGHGRTHGHDHGHVHHHASSHDHDHDDASAHAGQHHHDRDDL